MRSELPPTCGSKSRGHPACAAGIACQGSTWGRRVTGLGPRVSRLGLGLGCEGSGGSRRQEAEDQSLRMGSHVQGLKASGNTEERGLARLSEPVPVPQPGRVHERWVDPSMGVEDKVWVGGRGQHQARQLGEVRRGSGLVRVTTGII